MRRIEFLAAVAAAPLVPAGEARRTRFPTANGELVYERAGDGARLIVVLTGGPGLDPALAAPLVADLAGENAVVVLHQRGTGASADAPLAAADLTVAGAVADLEALRAALGLARLHLAGQSWGAMLAMAYAAAHPAATASLALLNPGGPDPGFMRDFGRRVMAKLTPAERTAYASAPLASPESLRLELLGDVHDRATIAPLLATIGPGFANARVFRSLMRDVQRSYDVRAALAGFPAPVLLLFGDDDPALAAKDELVALFPRARVTVLADSGHLGWLDRPLAYRDAVLAFTRTLPTT